MTATHTADEPITGETYLRMHPDAIDIGRNARIYPGVVLETQGAGRIVMGDHVVLSRGVHIVAFEHVVLGDDCMVGEHSSLRDANHRASTEAIRRSFTGRFAR